MFQKNGHTEKHFIILFSIALLARIWAELAVEHFTFHIPDLLLIRALFSDALTCFFIACVMGVIRWKPVIGLTYLLWAAFYAGNTAHIAVNNANIDFRNASELGEIEFLQGSVLSLDVLLPLAVFLAGIAILSRFLNNVALPSMGIKNSLLVMVISATVLHLIPADDNYWRYYNALEENSMELLEGYRARSIDLPKKQVNDLYHKMIRLDLNGRQLTQTPVEKPNILIITIEGLSDHHLQMGYMPYLKSLAKKNMYYPNFVAVQQYTRNGLYAILCGDYASLEFANMWQNKWYDTVNNGPRKPCLPKILGRHGYTSIFFQGSGLEFSAKNKFFKAIEFTHAYSAADLQRLSRSPRLMKENPMRFNFLGWGMADDVFLRLVARQLGTFHKQHKTPWFAALMTTGTHHPFHVTPEYARRFSSLRHAAFHRTDEGLKLMMDRLEKDGVLNNTLVMIMGDESHLTMLRNGQKSSLAANWGLLVIKTPDNVRHTSQDHFIQPDIVTSIMDYTGLSGSKNGFRSVFREYEAFRPIMFAGGFSKRWFAWPEKNQLIACKSNFRRCTSRYFNGKLFEAEFFRAAPADQIDLYISVARKSDRPTESRFRKRGKMRRKSAPVDPSGSYRVN